MLKKLLFFAIFVSSLFSTAQTTVKGTVYDEYLEPFPGATIKVPSGTTISDFEGNFTIKVAKLPVNVTVSSSGYSDETVQVTDASTEINIILKETFALNQIVLSASRTPERILESPVTIERAASKHINNTASPNFYEGLKNLKGVDVLDNNYLSKIIVSNRGFARTDNTRFVQLVDGMDTAAPAFQYSTGNVSGVSELDLKSAEILPGAASALYGASAFNGILLLTTKSPFEDTGISAYVKTGVTTQDNRGTHGFYDLGFRFAKKFSDKFALKVNLNFDKAEDWQANDITNLNGEGLSHLDGDSDFNGVNIYGDEVSLNVVDLAVLASTTEESPLFGQNLLGLLSSIEGVENTRISRTGFAEKDFVAQDANNLRIDASLHFRPWGENKTEIILGTVYNVGDNITQANNRYAQKSSSLNRYKFEIKGSNYFLRAYYSINDAGDTFVPNLAAVTAAEKLRNPIAQSPDGSDEFLDNGTYYTLYALNYFGQLEAGNTNEGAHLAAREFLNNITPTADSQEFQNALEEAKNITIADGGSILFENSSFYHVDANYNFADLLEFADIQAGGSFRSYGLDSKGQVYTDDDGILRNREFGLYTQLQKKIADDRLKFTATLRYDKSQNFDGKFTPRATLSYAAGEKKNHNFRVGYQTGFRNPTVLDQYAGLDLGLQRLLGYVGDNLEREEFTVTWVSDDQQQTTLSGVDVLENSFTAASVAEGQQLFRESLVDPSVNFDLTLFVNPDVKADIELVKPETVKSFELGYRGASNINGSIFEFDINSYYSLYEDFITNTEVVVPLYGRIDDLINGVDFSAAEAISLNDFQRVEIASNSKSKLNAYGFSAGFNTKIFNDYYLAGSYAFSDFSIDKAEDDIDFVPAFNTPKHAVKVQFGNENFYKNFGFGIDTRWQSEFLYETRVQSRNLPSRFVLDAQVNYKIPSIKSLLKIGGTNLTGKEYNSVLEAGTIGSQYYISFVYNN